MLPTEENLELFRPEFKLPIKSIVMHNSRVLSPNNNCSSPVEPKSDEEGFYKGIFNLSPKYIGDDYVSFEISADQVGVKVQVCCVFVLTKYCS